MKTKMRFSSTVAAWIVLISAAVLISDTVAAATLSLTPSAVSNRYAGVITLQAGSLSNGETVRIEKFADADSNGVVSSNDVLVQSFLLTDGVAATIGGATNINVPADYSPTNGTIVAPVRFQEGGIGQVLSAQYAVVLSSPTASFTPVTNLFNVTNCADGQSFTGAVKCDGTNVPFATILLFSPPAEGDEGMEFIEGTMADASGDYTLPAPASTYALFATRDGFVTDLSQAPVLTLGATETLNTNLSLTAATRLISGRVVDYANTNVGLAGLLVVCESDNDKLAIGFSDAGGYFSVPVIADVWSVGIDDQQTTFHGYLRLNEEPGQLDTTSGNVSNVFVAVPRSTALIYGNVKNDQNQPLVGVPVFGNSGSNGMFEAESRTDANGNYALGVVAGEWRASISSHDPAYSNYIFTQSQSTNISNGQAVLQNFIGIIATNQITGFVHDGGGNPITNLNVYAHADINGTMFSANGETDSNGDFTLNVASGTWYIGLNCNPLMTLGLQCPPERTTNILGADAVVNFIVSDLSITTTNLPDGTNGVFYSHQLNAGGGQPPYTWSLAPGFTNLPGGLTLSSNGVLSGTPTQYSFSGFFVRVTDDLGATADEMLNLYIHPAPLQITPVTLPSGTNGQYYFANLNASGGVPPYNWYWPGGPTNLPSGLSLSTNGSLSGVPTTSGNFNFPVAVWVNNPFQSVTQQVFLTITTAPLEITTTSPLPQATQDSYYNVLLSASGGLPPYTWSLAPGSTNLPTGLLISTNGVISGIPSESGPYSFTVRVTDDALTTDDALMFLMVNQPGSEYPTVVLTGISRSGSSQFRFTFNTLAEWNYTIQYSTDLSTWNSVLTIGGSGAPITIIDPNATTSRRFYRVKAEP